MNLVLLTFTAILLARNHLAIWELLVSIAKQVFNVFIIGKAGSVISEDKSRKGRGIKQVIDINKKYN
jgi:hypothetical protein